MWYFCMQNVNQSVLIYKQLCVCVHLIKIQVIELHLKLGLNKATKSI